MTTQPTPARAVDFYDNGAKFFEYTDPDGQIHYGKIQPTANGGASFDWEESAPEDWEDAEPFILAELDKQTPPPPLPGPTDLTDYLETHFEISAYLMATIETPGKMSNYAQETQGRGGLYELAQELTAEFEQKNGGKIYDGTFFEDLDQFIGEKETAHQQTQK